MKNLKVLLSVLIILIIVVSLLAGIGLVSCTIETNNNYIAGKWYDQYGNRVEFYNDGTVVFQDPIFGDVAGEYSFLDENHIKLSYEGLLSIIGDLVYEIEITENKLYLNSDIESLTYSKQPTSDAEAETTTLTVTEVTNVIEEKANMRSLSLFLIIFISIAVVIVIILIIYRAGRTTQTVFEQKQKNYCSKCGNKVSPESNFCNKCGTKL